MSSVLAIVARFHLLLWLYNYCSDYSEVAAILSEGNSWIVCLISYWVVTVECKITAMQLATG